MIDKLKFEKAVQDKIEEANKKYGLSIKILPVVWQEKGLAAGWVTFSSKGNYRLGLSEEAISLDPLHVLTITIPHEVAHLVTHKWGEGFHHKSSWNAVCLALGGNGKRCHPLGLSKLRKTWQYQYKLPSGRIVWVSSGPHRKIQKRHHTRIMKDTKERFAAVHFTGVDRLT